MPSTALRLSEGSVSPTDPMPAHSLSPDAVEAQASTSQPTSPSPNSRKTFHCSTCNKAFTTAGHLSRHVASHSGDKPYPCPYPGCDKYCSRRDNVLQHFRVHLPKAHRKRNATYVREAIQYMQNAENPAIAVLHLAGLLPQGPATDESSWSISHADRNTSAISGSESRGAISLGEEDGGEASDRISPDVQMDVEVLDATVHRQQSPVRLTTLDSEKAGTDQSPNSESRVPPAHPPSTSRSDATRVQRSRGFQESFLRADG